MVSAYIALGSNLGNRQEQIKKALEAMSTTPGIVLKRVSRLQETKPLGPIQQPLFINGVAQIETQLDPMELLDALLGIEQQLGRIRKERWGPRTIDLDILLYGDSIIDHPRLKVPHPELQNRPFLLDSLDEVKESDGN